ncbi:LytTR family DNA-binding domain-containing protein [Mucilaginibacter sp. BT774]|uniref:LytR/AlgR family response regulator transcription factor n=1 Tax=Mucilaginibacter sp. BT774 TaxID=3062276 RepID=UPI0026769870|nr:LytTR family DNA-binding domain-containing protein [Mucilaginibacter sp. BT774]MDO3627923.1 LytTR family DNA-binding domain-containing protein [Mucilaginibacter sp. BT774]
MKWSLARKLLHLLFWVIITTVFLFERRYLIQKAGLGHFAECAIVRLALIITLSYLNIFWLIPRYFSAKRYFTYTALLLLSLCLYLGLQGLYDIYLYGFVIGAVSYRSFWYSFPYNFLTSAWYLTITVAFELSLDWYRQRIKIKSLQEELERDAAVLQNGHSNNEYVFLKSGTRKLKTTLSSINYIQGLKDYSIIYTDEGKIIVKGSLKMAEELFPTKSFLRVHKSYLVAESKIKHWQGNKLVLINNEIIPIGRSYKHFLQSA